MKIVYNIYVAVRKLWNAIFGKNGDGSSVELIKGNPTVTAEAPNLTSIEINGTSYKIELSPEQVQEAVDYYLSGDPSVFENVVAPLIAPAWEDDKDYKVGILLSASGKMYLTIKDAPAGTPVTNTEYFEEKSVADIIEMIKTGEITVGKANLANNFDSKMVLTDNSGYLYRTTGGSLEVGEQNRVKKIIGASVPIIQIQSLTNLAASFGTYSTSTGKYTISTVGISNQNRIYSNASLPFYGGHKYLITATYLSTRNGTGILTNYNQSANSPTIGTFYFSVTANVKKTVAWITNCTTTGNADMRYGMPIGTDTEVGDEIYVTNVMVIDLTATFGTTVADRLYALEQAQAGTGIAKVKEILVKDYYPYNVTAFTHTKTSGKVNTGFNLFNLPALLEEIGDPINAVSNANLHSKSLWINNCNYDGRVCVYKNGITKNSGSITYVVFEYSDGSSSWGQANSQLENNTYIKSAEGKIVKQVIFAMANTGSYNFTNAEMCVSLSWDGERDGEYEAYQEWNYPVEDIELKGILSLDAQDNWVADGDEYLPSGSVSGRFDIKNLGQMVWQKVGDKFGTDSFNGTLKMYTTKLLCTNGYKVASPGYSGTVLNDMEMCSHNSSSNTLYIRDDRYETVEAFQSAMNNVYLLFEVQTPTESSADPYTELQNDSNWGTEKWIDTRDVPMPVFSTCEYIPDLKAKLETAPESPDEDGDYIMHRENGLNSYGSLSTWLSANGYNKLQDLLSVFGLKDALGGTLRHMLANSNENLDFANTAWIDLGDLNWTYNSTYGMFVSTGIEGRKDGSDTKGLCSIFTQTFTNIPWGSKPDKSFQFYYSTNTDMAVKDTSFGTDATAFKNAMKGQLLAYEKNITQ